MLQQLRFFLFAFFFFSTCLSASGQPPFPNSIRDVAPNPPGQPDSNVILQGGQQILITLKHIKVPIGDVLNYYPGRFERVEYLDKGGVNGAFRVIQSVGRTPAEVLNEHLNSIPGREKYNQSRLQRYIRVNVPTKSQFHQTNAPLDNKVWLRIIYRPSDGTNTAPWTATYPYTFRQN